MDDAAGHWVAAQTGQNLIMGFARMNQHWQPGAVRQLELADEQGLLTLAIQIREKKIQPDLPHRYGILAMDQGFEFFQVAGLVLSEIDRMQSQGWIKLGLSPAQGQQTRPAGGVDGGHHDGPHALAASRGQDLIPIPVEVTDVQVAMGIDQHARSPDQVIGYLVGRVGIILIGGGGGGLTRGLVHNQHQGGTARQEIFGDLPWHQFDLGILPDQGQMPGDQRPLLFGREIEPS